MVFSYVLAVLLCVNGLLLKANQNIVCGIGSLGICALASLAGLDELIDHGTVAESFGYSLRFVIMESAAILVYDMDLLQILAGLRIVAQLPNLMLGCPAVFHQPVFRSADLQTALRFCLGAGMKLRKAAQAYPPSCCLLLAVYRIGDPKLCVAYIKVTATVRAILAKLIFSAGAGIALQLTAADRAVVRQIPGLYHTLIMAIAGPA